MIRSKITFNIRNPKLGFKTRIQHIPHNTFSITDTDLKQTDVMIHPIVCNETCTVMEHNIQLNCDTLHNSNIFLKAHIVPENISCENISVNTCNIVTSVSAKNATEIMKHVYFPVFSAADPIVYETLLKKLKQKMMKKKITSKEYAIIGLYSNIPENFKYSYDSKKNRLFINVLDRSNKTVDFAIVKMKSGKIVKIDLK